MYLYSFAAGVCSLLESFTVRTITEDSRKRRMLTEQRSWGLNLHVMPN